MCQLFESTLSGCDFPFVPQTTLAAIRVWAELTDPGTSGNLCRFFTFRSLLPVNERHVLWLLLGSILHIFVFCGLVVEIQPFQRQPRKTPKLPGFLFVLTRAIQTKVRHLEHPPRPFPVGWLFVKAPASNKGEATNAITFTHR